MGKVFITRKGGPAGDKTGTPIVTITDISDTFVIADIENTDADEAKIYYEFDNADPSASSIVIAGETTETGVELNNLTPETSYVLYAKAAQEGVLFSDVFETNSFTTLEPQAFTYELLADVDVATSTNQIDFTGLNIDKNDELRLVYTLIGGSATTSIARLYVNDENTASSYAYQVLWGDGTSLLASRDTGDNIMAFALSPEPTSGFADIKIANNGSFVFQSQFASEIGADSNGLQNRNYNNVHKTLNLTTITKLSIVGSYSTALGVGSRFQLYKVNSGVA